MKIAILIVAYNAARTIESVLDRIPDPVWKRIDNVIIFDDCSQDETSARSKSWAGKYSDKIVIFENQVNLGYGGNQKRGYRYVIEQGYDIVVLLHGDGQYAPECMLDLIGPIARGKAQAVFGSRMMVNGAARDGGMPLYKYVGNKVLTGIQNTLLGQSFSEFHSGYRAYHVPTLKKLPLLENTNDFHFDTEIIIQLIESGSVIKEVPIPTYYGDEICHVNGVKYAKDVVQTSLKYTLHKKGLLYDKRFDLQTGAKYTLKENRYSSHQRILDLLTTRDEKSSLKKESQHILDVGCGSGLLAAKIIEKGINVTGVDVYDDPHAAEVCDRFIQIDLERGLDPVCDQRYDNIVFADVLEHVREPEKLLLEAGNMLEEDGAIIASTGNVAHIFVRLMLLFGRFEYTERGILDKTHVKLFTPGSFRRMIEDCSFEIVSTRYCSIPFENIIPGHKRFTDALCWIYMRFVHLLPSLFAYQVILVAKPKFDNPGTLTRNKTILEAYAPYKAEPLEQTPPEKPTKAA